MPPNAQVSGPTPETCLNDAGLLRTHAMQFGIWEAFDPTNNQPVFVDGPYTNPQGAESAAQALTGIEEENAGGLYRVTASLHSLLTFKVNAVASCLSGTSGKGVLTF